MSVKLEDFEDAPNYNFLEDLFAFDLNSSPLRSHYEEKGSRFSLEDSPFSLDFDFDNKPVDSQLFANYNSIKEQLSSDLRGTSDDLGSTISPAKTFCSKLAPKTASPLSASPSLSLQIEKELQKLQQLQFPEPEHLFPQQELFPQLFPSQQSQQSQQFSLQQYLQLSSLPQPFMQFPQVPLQKKLEQEQLEREQLQQLELLEQQLQNKQHQQQLQQHQQQHQQHQQLQQPQMHQQLQQHQQQLQPHQQLQQPQMHQQHQQQQETLVEQPMQLFPPRQPGTVDLLNQRPFGTPWNPSLKTKQPFQSFMEDLESNSQSPLPSNQPQARPRKRVRRRSPSSVARMENDIIASVKTEALVIPPPDSLSYSSTYSSEMEMVTEDTSTTEVKPRIQSEDFEEEEEDASLAEQLVQYLISLKASISELESLINKVSVGIQAIVSPFDSRECSTLLSHVRKLKADGDQRYSESLEAEARWLLSGSQLNQLYLMQCELRRLGVQLDIYKKELQHMTNNEVYGDRLFATLFLYSSPFPTTVKQKRHSPYRGPSPFGRQMSSERTWQRSRGSHLF